MLLTNMALRRHKNLHVPNRDSAHELVMNQKRSRPMTNSLPPPATGNPPEIPEPVEENERIASIPYRPEPTTTAAAHANKSSPIHRPDDFIPTDLRNRLREIVLKTRDPRKTLRIFQSRTPLSLAPAIAGAVKPPHPLPRKERYLIPSP